ncbi:MAG: HAMP domain-containing histidine kinase [Clostridium sp.]|nr:HAMP domain-containing histidine kinase [Clostridium sp.]
MWLQILLAIVIWAALGTLFYYFLWAWYHSRVWYGYERFYRLIQEFDMNRNLVIALYMMFGTVCIFCFFLRRTFTYLQEVVRGTEEFYREGSSLIELPQPLKEVENRLNQARVEILNNERNAREAEQRKNDLVTYLAHDLKTPITSVIGYLTLLQDEPQISEGLRGKYTGIALDKAERLEELINEFFEITRFNLSQLTLETENVHLSRMLEQIVSEFYPILTEKGLSWRTDIEAGIEIVCDPDKLERVFDNLVRNAISYSYPQTEIFLSMKMEADEVEIVVKNYGKTIPKDKLERIFEQFFRVDSARSSSTGGTGLGLAISKEIVELHGGTITAKSEKQTVVFTVRLPVDCQKIV